MVRPGATTPQGAEGKLMADEAEGTLPSDQDARNSADRQPFDDQELVDRITAEVVKRGGVFEGGEWRFPCWNATSHTNGDASPSRRWNPSKATHYCDPCGEGGGAVDLAKRFRLSTDTAQRRATRARAGKPSRDAGAASSSEAQPPSTVEGFAQARGIAHETLERFEVRRDTGGPRPALRYPTSLGVDRLKYLDGKKPKYSWAASGGGAHGYGLPTASALLDRGGGPLYLVNGEPSVWACASRDVPAFALCAGEGVKIPEALIEDLRTALPDVAFRVVFDADTAGRAGALKCAAALRAAGCDVQALDISAAVPDIVGGDVDDLHRRVGAGLADALAALPMLGEEKLDGDHDSGTSNRASSKTRGSQATQLIDLADDWCLWHDSDGDPYVDIQVHGHRETHALKSRTTHDYLARCYYLKHRHVASGDAMREALLVLTGKARWDGPEHTVAVRVAGDDGAIYLDLGDADWRSIEVTAAGWRIIQESPVRFRRPRALLPLPDPVRGGALDDLREVINVRDDDDWALLMSWELSAFRPRGPYPVLDLYGEAGTAKSDLARILRSLIDPNLALLRRPPSDERDVIIAGLNGWIVALDNLSHIPPWLSDTLCRLSTGGGYGTREFYTNLEEVVVDLQRPAILTGIEALAERGDLADRTIAMMLAVIEEKNRMTEEEVWAKVRRLQPGVLGALLDAVVGGLRALPDVRLDRVPRMADFARWATACEPVLGSPDAFTKAYDANRRAGWTVTIEASAVGAAVLRLATIAPPDGWVGSMASLLGVLSEGVPDTIRRDEKRWPRTARGLTGHLTRLAPALRAAGISVEMPDHSKRKPDRLVRIKHTPTSVDQLPSGGSPPGDDPSPAGDAQTPPGEPIPGAPKSSGTTGTTGTTGTSPAVAEESRTCCGTCPGARLATGTPTGTEKPNNGRHCTCRTGCTGCAVTLRGSAADDDIADDEWTR
jgi:hypothetical protein